MSDPWERLRTSGTVVGASLESTPFYVMFTLEDRSDEEALIEVTFSPENILLDGAKTDVVVTWGTYLELREWVQDFVRNYSIQIAPEFIQWKIVERFFAGSGERSSTPNVSDPWLDGVY